MRVRDWLAARTAVQERVHHLPHNRAWPDDRDLDDEIVEAFGTQPRQRGHLCARLDLEYADRVSFLQHLVDDGIVRR
jgi:hypothetical protein